ncbi:MAG: polyprenyl synthetase family protein [Chloroflexota bacterium]|nr:polyprenyl synthetase family protein [Chloroflexota bacterium]
MSPSSLAAESALGQLSAVVDCELRRLFEALPSGAFLDLMQYHLGWKDERLEDVRGWTGKRVRSAMCLLACQATSGDYRKALPAATGIELLHNFTLIHDDIEDGDPMRRNRPAVWTLWGIPQAMNVGDGMHSLAKIALADDAGGRVSPTELVLLSKLVDEASLRLCEGQHLDLLYQGIWDVSVEQYLDMVGKKSAALISCSVHCGAMLGTSDGTIQERYRDFGELIGLAFQIRDDVLAIWGREALTGKPCGDLTKRKKTLPLIYARQQLDPAGRDRLQQLLGAGCAGQETDVHELLERTGAKRWAVARAADYRDRALAALDATGIRNESQEALRTIAGFLIDREY